MTNNTAQANLEMSSWYEKRRDELLGLLKESTAIEIPEKYMTELGQITRKCQENSFEIALVGEFQGGKSTTFNALCDGRDISPRGLNGGGIKTSAAVISAQNISDDEKKEMPDGKILDEWAEITFKTDTAIVLSIATILRPVILNNEKLFAEFSKTIKEINDPEELKCRINIDEGLQELLDLKKKEHREILNEATSILWEKWNDIQKRIFFSPEDLDQLRIATLQLRFYGTEEYKHLLTQNLLPIDQFQKFIAFPDDWSTRWLEGANSKFSIEEVAFVFIHSVLVRLHSQNLKRLGCQITDCPGLFANSFDTQIAERTMHNADAIWYLIDGSKQIGQKDLEIIRKISSMGMLGKIEATCNLKGNHKQITTQILPVTKSILCAQGLNLEVFPYNARMAFLSMQGNLLLNKSELFSDLDYRNMKKDAEVESGNPDPKELWANMVLDLGALTRVMGITAVKTLDDSTVNLVREKSNFDKILTSLEDEIIPKKAQSILVDNGSERVAKALIEYEGSLKAVEDAAKAKVEEWKAMVDEARKQLADFIKKSEKIIENSEIGTATKREQLADKIANDILDYTLDDTFVKELSRDVSRALVNIEERLKWNEDERKADFINQLSPEISKNYREALTRGIDQWMYGQDLKSFSILQNILKRIHDNIQREWENKKFSVNSIFQGISIPEISDSLLTDNCKNLTSMIVDNDAIYNMKMNFKETVSAMFRWSLHLLSFIKKIKNYLETSKEEKIEEKCEKIRPEIIDIVEKRAFRRQQAEPIIQQLVDSTGVLSVLVDNLKQQLAEMKNIFEARVTENENNFQKSSEERNKIADDNNKLRTETIEPLRKRIEGFKDSVIKELGQFA